jgi:hypothetical protein
MSDGFKAAGTFLQVEPPHLVVFTWGFADEEAAQHVKHEQAGASSVSAMPAGSTRVTVTLQEADGGTRLTGSPPALTITRHAPDNQRGDGRRAGRNPYAQRQGGPPFDGTGTAASRKTRPQRITHCSCTETCGRPRFGSSVRPPTHPQAR